MQLSEKAPLIADISEYVKRRNFFNVLFYSVGFLSEIFFSYIFWNVPVRFVRDLYFFSLSMTGFNPTSLLFLSFFLPPVLLLIQPLSNLFMKVYPVFYSLLFISFSLTIVEQPILMRAITQMICSFFSFLWFDIRLQENSVAMHKRFIHAQSFCILISSVSRFSTISFIPFYYLPWYYGVIFLVVGFCCLVYLSFEEIVLKYARPNELEKINREYFDFHFTMLRDDQNMIICRNLGDKETIEKYKSLAKSPKINFSVNGTKKSLGAVAKFFVSLVSIIFWAMGFSFVIYVIQRYVTAPVSTTIWCSYPYPYAIFVCISFFVGIILSSVGFTQSPVFFLLTTIPSMIIFATVNVGLISFIAGLTMILTLPSLLQFFLYENRFVFGKLRGGVGLSSCFYVLMMLSASSVVLHNYLQPFGTLFGLNSFLIMVLGICVLGLSYLSFFINRLYFIGEGVRNACKDRNMIMWIIFTVFMFPQYFSEEKLKKYVEQNRGYRQLKESRNEDEILNEVLKNEEACDEEKGEDELSDYEMIEEGDFEYMGEDFENRENLKAQFSKLFQIEDCDAVLKILMFVIIFVCACLSLPFFLVGETYTVKPHHEDFLRVATFNIFQGYTYYGSNSAPKIVDLMMEQEIDVIGFQESNAAQAYNGYQSILDYIGINTKSSYYQGLSGSQPSIGASFVSRHKIFHSKSEVFPMYKDPRALLRPMISNDIVFNDTVIHFKTVHLDFNEMAIPQIEILFTEIKNIKTPVIVLGDFNNRPNSTVYNMMIDNGFKDSYFEVNGFYNATTHSETNSQPIDYVFVKENGANIEYVKSVVIVSDVSDHFCVITDFKIRY